MIFCLYIHTFRKFQIQRTKIIIFGLASIISVEEEATVSKVIFDELSEKFDMLYMDYEYVKAELNELREENKTFKERQGRINFSFNYLRNNPSQLKFYTGLTHVALFDWLIKKIKVNVQAVHNSLTLADHLLVVLVKLRLGTSNRDLACRFMVSESAVSRILRSWLPIMAGVMKPLIRWPSKNSVMNNMPKLFNKKFRNARAIIDCTEIFIERPTNLTTRAQTWSNYKHHNTMKYLVGITPSGSISFLSSGWGGRTSDKEITVESGFLDLLEPYDEILADRGFLVRDELATRSAYLRIPGFIKGKKQMPGMEVDSARQLSRARIHVERVIGRWKNYKILQSVVPISQIDLLNDIVIVCAGLTNLCPSIMGKKKNDLK